MYIFDAVSAKCRELSRRNLDFACLVLRISLLWGCPRYSNEICKGFHWEPCCRFSRRIVNGFCNGCHGDLKGARWNWQRNSYTSLRFQVEIANDVGWISEGSRGLPTEFESGFDRDPLSFQPHLQTISSRPLELPTDSGTDFGRHS